MKREIVGRLNYKDPKPKFKISQGKIVRIEKTEMVMVYIPLHYHASKNIGLIIMATFVLLILFVRKIREKNNLV